MEFISSYFEQSQLSQAAYASLYAGMSSGVYIDALQEDDLMSAAQAEAFANDYAVIDQYTDATGFSGTVFEKDGAYYFAIRGSENIFTSGGAIDWFGTDFDEIGSEGIAISQGLAMFNWLQRLLGEADSSVIQYTYNANGTISTFTDTATGFLYGQNTPMSVAGHSLGGHLAMMLGRLAPDLFGTVYTFNAPGFDVVGADLTSAGFFDALSTATVPVTGSIGADWQADVTVNWNVEGDIVNQIGSTPGNAGTVFSESANQGSIDAHDIGAMTDSLAVYALFGGLSTTADMSTLGKIFNAATNTLAMTLETLVNAVGDLFGVGDTITPAAEDVRDALYTRILAIQNDAAYQAAVQAADFTDIVSLSGLDSRSISTLAQADTDEGQAYRYALVNLLPFVITGDDTLYAPHNETNELDLYDVATGEGTLTAAYLDDRAAMLLWKLKYDSGAYDDNDWLLLSDKTYSEAWDSDSVVGDWRYTDYATLIIKLCLGVRVMIRSAVGRPAIGCMAVRETTRSRVPTRPITSKVMPVMIFSTAMQVTTRCSAARVMITSPAAKATTSLRVD